MWYCQSTRDVDFVTMSLTTATATTSSLSVSSLSATVDLPSALITREYVPVPKDLRLTEFL